ncbi:efflux RND transporter periplasmic adaptor subunit [Aliikangiella marina]|uniref:Efflux RND transporter periplasmic adaptor subunit n=1 Tax=Aliikangiella marina TaxID=1712262 RepID=A0A545TI98_9GAMM|nr:efflux RND transporter periplasmic adaptor subunit [Aliikangiella marina]TQV76959.1 efflux RND transporter periplasmic adaptor subunit [Aliikangiella marina]
MYFKFHHSRLFAVLAISSVLLVVSCSNDAVPAKGAQTGKKPTQTRPSVKPIPVETTLPSQGTAASYYVTTATLAPSSDAQINARTSGVVREILREEGDDVKAGDVLLKLEDDDQKLRLKQAKQKFASAEREFNRLSKMKSAGAVSPTEWETANNNYLTSRTDVELAELALSYTQIVAPFDGRVVWREVDLGAHVTTGNLLFRMMAINPLLVRVHVPANRIGKVAKGQIVELNIDSVADKVEARVDLVSPIVDPTTGTVKVTLRLDNYPQGVRPGDFTEIKMITDQRENALLLPSVAIIEERGSHYLFVEEQSKAVRKTVQVGYVLGDQTEVTSGIQKSDRVVIKGQRNLKEGNPLKVITNSNDNPLVQKTEDQRIRKSESSNEI